MKWLSLLLLLVGCTPTRHANSCGPYAIHELLAHCSASVPTTQRISDDILSNRNLVASAIAVVPMWESITWPDELRRVLRRYGVRLVEVCGTDAELREFAGQSTGIALERDSRSPRWHWCAFPLLANAYGATTRVEKLYVAIGSTLDDAGALKKRLDAEYADVVFLTQENSSLRRERNEARAATRP